MRSMQEHMANMWENMRIMMAKFEEHPAGPGKSDINIESEEGWEQVPARKSVKPKRDPFLDEDPWNQMQSQCRFFHLSDGEEVSEIQKESSVEASTVGREDCVDKDGPGECDIMMESLGVSVFNVLSRLQAQEKVGQDSSDDSRVTERVRKPKKGRGKKKKKKKARSLLDIARQTTETKSEPAEEKTTVSDNTVDVDNAKGVTEPLGLGQPEVPAATMEEPRQALPSGTKQLCHIGTQVGPWR